MKNTHTLKQIIISLFLILSFLLLETAGEAEFFFQQKEIQNALSPILRIDSSDLKDTFLKANRLGLPEKKNLFLSTAKIILIPLLAITSIASFWNDVGAEPLKPPYAITQQQTLKNFVDMKISDSRIGKYLRQQAPHLVIDERLQTLLLYLGKIRPYYSMRVYSRKEFSTWQKINQEAGVYGGSAYADENHAEFYGPKLTIDTLGHELFHAILRATIPDYFDREKRLIGLLNNLRRANSHDTKTLSIIEDFLQFFRISYCVPIDKNKNPATADSYKPIPLSSAELAYNTDEMITWLFQRLIFPEDGRKTIQLTQEEQNYFSAVSPEALEKADALLSRIARNPKAKKYLIDLYVRQLKLPMSEQAFIKAFERIALNSEKHPASLITKTDQKFDFSANALIESNI